MASNRSSHQSEHHGSSILEYSVQRMIAARDESGLGTDMLIGHGQPKTELTNSQPQLLIVQLDAFWRDCCRDLGVSQHPFQNPLETNRQASWCDCPGVGGN